MQVPAAAIRGSHAAANAALIGLKTFTRRSKRLSEFPQVQANMGLIPTQGPGEAAGEEESQSASTVLVDGKLNFRVRKRRQTTVTKKADESEQLAPNPPLVSTAGDLPSAASLLASEVEISAAVVVVHGSPSGVASAGSGMKSRVRRESVRLKRAAEVPQSLGATELSENSHRTARRVSRKNAVAAKPKAEKAEMGLPAPTASTLENAVATDFWHSSLSEPQNSGVTIVKDLVEAAIPPIISSKRLSAAEDIAVALAHLRSADPLLKGLIELHDPPKFEKCESAFAALAQSIVFQQLATKAAGCIFGRLVTLCEGLNNLTPTTISQLSAEQMRAIGVSGRKASYLHDLAANFLSGTLSDTTINDMDDESLMMALTAVKGIGMWSVHMFMLFSLHKSDVLPVSDLGVRKGIQKLYSLKELPNPAQAEKIASSWQPYRSVGSWYMWRVMSSAPKPEPKPEPKPVPIDIISSSSSSSKEIHNLDTRLLYS